MSHPFPEWKKPTHTSAHPSISPATGSRLALLILLALAGLTQVPARETDFIPLPYDAVPSSPASNPIMDLAVKVIDTAGKSFSPKLPEAFVLRNEGGTVHYDSATRIVTYSAGSTPLYLRTAEGQEIYTSSMQADFEKKEAKLQGPLVIYQGETLTRAESGFYKWEEGTACVKDVRAKVNGLIVRGSSVEYKKDDKGESYLTIRDAYVTTEDEEKPGLWVGTGELTVYPGDYGVISRLSLATDEYDVAVPVLGWVPISHSLNPREGYLPMPGSKSKWGAFLKNRYGFLLGNRRVERGMPVSDYVATALLDYRSHRGYAGGMELMDDDMRRHYQDMDGFAAYYANDRNPDINPTRSKRQPISANRYRVALQAMWKLPEFEPKSAGAHWTGTVNLNVLSDKYMLSDFFEDLSRTADKPDNSVRIERRTKESQTLLFTRFAPNDFYDTDERTELSYYRARSTIGNTRISYETRNSAGILRQNLPADQRTLYQQRIKRLKDEDLQNYYTRLLNTAEFGRINSTHEFSSTFTVLQFLNVTPKLGAGFSGYYGVEGVGSDNRALGYMACDFDIKFHRYFDKINIPAIGVYGLYHVFHPYATLSHGTISSSNPMVPQMDSWSSTLGSSTINPMPLDLMSYTGIDGWNKWTVWRIGAQNTLSTISDGESRTLLNWNVFIDYNINNPNTESSFSNLYSIVSFYPSRLFRISLETQTPTIKGGDGFNQYNTSITMQPTPWLETQFGHRYISSHPVQRDASQLHTTLNLRLNEKYTVSSRVYWDVENKRIPIQQYSVFRKFGAWYIGATVFLRDNGGKKETGLGASFTLGETGTALPVNFF